MLQSDGLRKDLIQLKTILHHALSQFFNEEELKTLCFELDLNYDSLLGNGSTAKARELIQWHERRNRLEELANLVLEKRPWLTLKFEPQRFRELQELLLDSLQPSLVPAFQEFTSQVNIYLLQITQLHNELEEWKDLHNVLHKLNSSFATCRGYAISLSKIDSSIKENRLQIVRLIFELEVNWKICRTIIGREIKVLANSIEFIGDPYHAGKNTGPEWFLKLSVLSNSTDKIFIDEVDWVDLITLSNQLLTLDEVIEEWIYRADSHIKKIVRQITQLPRPSLFMHHR